MTTTDLQQLLASKSWRAEFTVNDSSLRIFLQDLDSGNCSVLAIEPVQLALPDERTLEYSWQDIRAELGPPPDECLIANLKTNIAPAYEKGEIPFMFD